MNALGEAFLRYRRRPRAQGFDSTAPEGLQGGTYAALKIA